MRKQKLLIPVLLILVAVLLLPVGTAAAQATSTPFELYEFVCGYDLSNAREWFYGDIWHIRDQVVLDEYVSVDGPLGDGTNTMVVGLNLSESTLHVTGIVKFSLQPDGGDGGYEGTLSVQAAEWYLSGHGVGQGTGDWSGQKIVFDLEELYEIPSEPASPCDSPGTAYRITGVILDPHGE